jgi:hypothetical protein
MRLVGTTKTTIASVRDRTHWNASTLTPMDPVTLGLCSQIELDFEVQRAAKEKPVPAAYGGATLLPASETTRKDEDGETGRAGAVRRGGRRRGRLRQAQAARRQPPRGRRRRGLSIVQQSLPST